MSPLLTLFSYIQTRIAGVRDGERGMVALEYVLLGAALVAIITLGVAAFSTDLQAAFARIL